MKKLLVIILVLSCSLVANAQYRTDWKYNSSDLSGKQCLQDGVDLTYNLLVSRGISTVGSSTYSVPGNRDLIINNPDSTKEIKLQFAGTDILTYDSTGASNLQGNDLTNVNQIIYASATGYLLNSSSNGGFIIYDTGIIDIVGTTPIIRSDSQNKDLTIKTKWSDPVPTGFSTPVISLESQSNGGDLLLSCASNANANVSLYSYATNGSVRLLVTDNILGTPEGLTVKYDSDAANSLLEVDGDVNCKTNTVINIGKLNLVPILNPPASANKGDTVYIENGATNAAYMYDGTTWNSLW